MGGRPVDCGFTFIEMVLTLTVLGIVSVMAIPAFVETGEAQVDGAAIKVVSDLSYARRLAQNRNALYGVSFDSVAEAYTVHLYDPATNTETAVSDPLTGSSMTVDFGKLPGLKGTNIQSVAFGAGEKVRFMPQGIPEDVNGSPLTASGSVVLSRGGSSRTVFVQPNTGEVSYQ